MMWLVHCGKERCEIGEGEVASGDTALPGIGECDKILGVVPDGDSDTPCMASSMLGFRLFRLDVMAMGALDGGASDVLRGGVGCSGCNDCGAGDVGAKRESACERMRQGAKTRRRTRGFGCNTNQQSETRVT